MDSRYLRDKEELKPDADKVDGDRRALLTGGLVGGAVAAAALMSTAAHAQAPAAPALADKPWWPHPKWGKVDMAGASNWITPAKVLDTVKWIKDGKIYRIRRVYEFGMPMFGERAFTLRIPGRPTGGPFGSNRLIYNASSCSTRSGRPARSSMASPISAFRSARTASRTRCATTTASPSSEIAVVPTA